MGFCRIILVSIESSGRFIQRNPLVSSAFIVLFIVYLFLSYIYHFLVYFSPFLLCTAIFVTIFWSSEQSQLKFVRGDEKKGEQRRIEKQFSEIPSIGRRDLLERKYSLRNATSRRRNFLEKKWDVQGVVEEKERDLPGVTGNEYGFNEKISERNTENDVKSSQRGERFLDSAEKFQTPKVQNLPLQDSKLDVRENAVAETEKLADGNDEEEEEEEESKEVRNKAVEWTKDDQKNLMDLGISEMERNRRLESLIARRRARQLLKLQIEKGLIDKRSVAPSQIAPLFISRGNPLDSPKDYEGIDGLDIPGSAPSVLKRNPFDLPYDPSEEKPNLTGDSFQQEFASNHQKDMTFCRHESFSLGSSVPLETVEPYRFFINGRKISDKLGGFPRFRKLPVKGNHDSMIEQLFSKEGDSMSLSSSNIDSGNITGVRVPNSLLNNEETTFQEDDMVDIEGEEVKNVHVTKSMSDHTSESNSTKNSNYGFAETDHKKENAERAGVSEKPESRIHKPNEKFLNFPISSSTAIDESSFDPFSPPTDKHQENTFFAERCIFHKQSCSIASDLQVEVSEIGSPTPTVDDTNTSTDEESVVFDGDIDKDITSVSDVIEGGSMHSREVHGVGEEDIAKVGFPEVSNNSKITASLIPLQRIDEDDAADVSSFSSTSGMPGQTPTHAIKNYDHNIFYNVKKSVVETKPPQPSNSSVVSSPQNHFTDSSVDPPPHETQSENLEERWNLSEYLTNEAQVVNHVDDSTAINTRDLNSNENPGPSIVHQESFDLVSVNSFSSLSPRSVLPEKTLTDQVSSPAFDQQIHTVVPQLNIEDMAQTTSNNELPPDTMPHNMQPLMVDLTIQPHNGAFSNSQEASCSSSVADDSNSAGKLMKPIFDDGDRKEERNPCEAAEGITEACISYGTSNSKLLEDNNTSIIPDNKEKLKNDTPPEPDKPNDSSEKLSNVHSESKKNGAVIYKKEDVKEKLKNDISSKPSKPNDSSEKVSNVHYMQPLADDSNTTEKLSKPIFDDEEDGRNSCQAAEGKAEACSTYGTSPVHSKQPEDNNTSIKPRNKELADPLDISSGRPKISGKLNDAVICKKEDRVKLKNGEHSKDKSTLLIRQDDVIKSATLAEITPLEDMDNKSSKVVDNEVTSGPLKVNEKIGNSIATEDAKMAAGVPLLVDVNPPKPNDSLEEASNVHSESKNGAVICNKEDVKEKLKNDIPPKSSKSIDSSEEVSNMHSDSKKNDAVICNKEDVKEKLKNDVSPKPNTPNDNSEKVIYVHSGSKELAEDEKDKLASGSITKDLQQQLMVNEETMSRSAEDN